MREADVIAATTEAMRFLEAVDALNANAKFQFYGRGNYEGGKYTAAVKRASSDLSAALVELRKSGRR